MSRRPDVVDRTVARVLAAAEPLPPPGARPALVVLVGAPGVGKSTFARALRARTGAAIVESDAVRRAMFRRPAHTKEESGRVFEAVHAALRALLGRGVSAIADATNLIEAERATMYRVAEACGARLVVVRLTAPAALVRRRLGGRGALEAGAEVFERMRLVRQPLTRPHYVVDTTGDTGAAIEAIAREIEAR